MYIISAWKEVHSAAKAHLHYVTKEGACKGAELNYNLIECPKITIINFYASVDKLNFSREAEIRKYLNPGQNMNALTSSCYSKQLGFTSHVS
jgi:hypothetical protein